MNIRVKNDAGRYKEVKLGFSWTTLFFGALVPLIRGDWKWFVIYIGAAFVLGFIGLPQLAPLLNLGFPFVYNKLYAQDLVNEGYYGITKEEDQALASYVN